MILGQKRIVAALLNDSTPLQSDAQPEGRPRPQHDGERQGAVSHGAGAVGQRHQQTHTWKGLQDLSAGALAQHRVG